MHKIFLALALILSVMLLDLSAFAAKKKSGGASPKVQESEVEKRKAHDEFLKGSHRNGNKIVHKKCMNCHKGKKMPAAPKLGDKAAWEPRLQKGLDALVGYVLHDEYHPRCKGCSTSEVKEAVKYMANNSGTGGNYTLW